MANRIYITHSDRVTIQEAIEAVRACLVHDVKPGELVTLSNSNGMAVYYNDKTKHPTFQVWRAEI